MCSKLRVFCTAPRIGRGELGFPCQTEIMGGGRGRGPTGGLRGGRRGQIQRPRGPKPCAPANGRKRERGPASANTKSFPAQRRPARTTGREDGRTRPRG